MAKFTKSQKLSEEKEKAILVILCHVITRLKKMDQVAEFLSNLLTPAETRMIAKRLAVANMLIENHKYKAIAKELNVGEATVARMSEWINNSEKGFLESYRISRSFKPNIGTPKKWHELTDFEKLMEMLGSYNAGPRSYNQKQKAAHLKTKQTIHKLKRKK
ncbi:MAG: hypothetical protein CMI52_03215 [Parcubacteria group bacterium]|nr:hypothetical protein [Parcubacteria group bacterium]|tara:strand:- start:381 stop:863 length:483 start_codon:yes stop_codon:yes gene_type:complete